MRTPPEDNTEDPGLPSADLSVPREQGNGNQPLHLDELMLEEHEFMLEEDQEAKLCQAEGLEFRLHENGSLREKACCSKLPPPAKGRELTRLLIELQKESMAAAARQKIFFEQLLDKQRRLELLLVNGDANSATEAAPNEVEHVSARGSVSSGPRSNASRSSGTQSLSSRSKIGSSISLSSEATVRRQPTPVPFRTSNRRSNLRKSLTVGSWSSSEGEQSFKDRLERLLRRKEFEYGAAGAILINAFIMCWECQYQGLDVGFDLQYPGHPEQAEAIWAGADTAFTFFDWFFGLVFLLEMIVKLICWRCKYFYYLQVWDDDDWDLNDWMLLLPRCLWSWQCWNILDSVCVLAFLIDKVATFGSVNPNMLRLLRLFRLFRLVRLLRFLENLDHLYIMATAISGLSRVLSWAIVLLTMMLLTCNLFLVQILHAAYFNGVTATDLTTEQLKKHHEMYEYFGTCTRCMLSMFEITLGNWPPVVRLLSEEVSEWFMVICLAHKLTIGFAVIGVITGVILQETFKVAQTDDLIMFRQKKLASSTLRRKMKFLFEALDQEGDGRLTIEEFTAIGDFPEIQCWLASLDIETDDLKTLFELIDIDNSGYITLDELVGRIPRIKGHARCIDMLAIRQQLQHAEGPCRRPSQ